MLSASALVLGFFNVCAARWRFFFSQTRRVVEQFLVSENGDHHQDTPDDHKNISNVKNGKANEADVEKVDHIVQADTVDQITDGAADDHGQRQIDVKIPLGLWHDDKEVDQHDNKNQGEKDQEDLLPGKDTESSAGILHVGQVKNMGNDWDSGDGRQKCNGQIFG